MNLNAGTQFDKVNNRNITRHEEIKQQSLMSFWRLHS